MRFRWIILLLWLAVWAGPTLHGAPDGTYADWRRQAWRSALATNDVISGPEADPDLDGLANFLEYSLGLDPAAADPGEHMVWQRSTNGTRYLLSLRASTSATEAAVKASWSEEAVPGPWTSPDGTHLVEIIRGQGAASVEVDYVFPLQSTGQGFARVLASTVPLPPPSPKWTWFEAEPPGHETHPELSGGQMAWLGPGGAIQKPLVVPAAGTYHLWVRKFWNPQWFRWQVGTNDAWKEVPRSSALVDVVVLGTNTARRMGWLNAGPVDLTAGAHRFHLEVPRNATDTTAYDCFLLTRDTFLPRGILKPDERVAVEEPGWFAFQPEPDPLTHSPIDLRWLNEAYAGEGGFLRVQGEDFVQEQGGKRMRFWGVNVGADVATLAQKDLDLFARSLAKRGVNLVRFHGPICTNSGPNVGGVDTNAVARLHRLIASLKREGIYTSLSIYFPLWFELGPSHPQFPGYNRQHPFGLVYFSTNFQSLYRGWWQHLMKTTNAYTGLPLKDEPAVPFVELVNEDSTLFWTFDPYNGATGNIPDAQRSVLEKQFGDWLLARYTPRTLSTILSQIWLGVSSPQDNLGAGRVGIRSLWDIATVRGKRDQDTAEFLTTLMEGFYRSTCDYLRTNLSYRGLICASNWKTAHDEYLGPLDKYANRVADFYDRHGYFGGYHVGIDASWSIQAGQTYEDRAAPRFQPETGALPAFVNPVFDLAYEGKPSIVSELNWPLPNRFRADMVFLAATYATLQGSDALGWFAATAPAWETLPGKFAIQTPVGLGQFPAAALIYRLGLVQTGPRVAELQVQRTNVFALRGAPVPAAHDFAALRGTNVPPGGILTNVAVLDSLAFAVGRTSLRFATNAQAVSRVTDLSPYVDRTQRTAGSAGGELRWDYGVGLVTLDAPAAQGATGFLSQGGALTLGDVTLDVPLEYGTVLVVSLDGTPIATASRLLVQVMSEEKPLGWQTSAETGLRSIVSAGRTPLLVRRLAGTVTLNRPDAATLTITPLDANGYRQPELESTGGSLHLRPDTFHYLVER